MVIRIFANVGKIIAARSPKSHIELLSLRISISILGFVTSCQEHRACKKQDPLLIGFGKFLFGQLTFNFIRNFGIKLMHALRTNTVGKLGIGMFLYINFHPFPKSLVSANFVATGADGNQPAQGLDIGESLFQFLLALL